MKFSFCSIAFRKTGESLTEIIPRLAEIGYEGVEVWANHLTGDGSDAETICACLNEHDMSVPMISPYFNITGDEREWESTLDSARRYFSYARILKAPLVRVFTGYLGSEDIEPAAWASAVGRLAYLCDKAAESGLSLALETHPKTLVDTVPSVLRLLADVARPNLGLNLDIYHLWERHQDPLWIWARLKSVVHHIHAKNAKIAPGDSEKYPLFHDKQGLQEIEGVTFLADGNMDYAPFMSALNHEEFDRWVSIEWFGADPFAAAAHEFDWLRRMTAQRDNEVTVT